MYELFHIYFTSLQKIRGETTTRKKHSETKTYHTWNKRRPNFSCEEIIPVHVLPRNTKIKIRISSVNMVIISAWLDSSLRDIIKPCPWPFTLNSTVPFPKTADRYKAYGKSYRHYFGMFLHSSNAQFISNFSDLLQAYGFEMYKCMFVR